MKKNLLLLSFLVILCGTAKAEPVGEVFGNTTLCHGDTLKLTALYSDGTDSLEYTFAPCCGYIMDNDDILWNCPGTSTGNNVFTLVEKDACISLGSFPAVSEYVVSVIVRVRNTITNELLEKVVNITIIQPATPPAITSPAPVCEYETVSIVQPPAYGLTFEYPDTPNPDAITVPGIYNILVTDTTGCAPVGSDIWLIPDTVSHIQRPDFAPETPVSGCEVASIEQTPETDVSFLYFLADKTAPLANPAFITASDTYYICKTDDISGCHSDTVPVAVTVHSRPVFSVAAPAPVCEPATVDITLPFEAGFTYQYYQPDGTTPLANPDAIAVSGTYYISKTETATTCTSDTLPVLVTVHPKPVFTPTTPASVCSPNTISIEQPDEYGYTFHYFTDAAATDILPDYTVIENTATYYITKTDDATGCTSDAMPVLARVNQTPTAVAGADRTICEGLQTMLGATAVAGVSYSWLPTINLSDAAASNPNATVGATITYTLTAQLTAAPECFTTDSVTITALPVPQQFALFGGGIYCRGDAYRNTKVGVMSSQTDVVYTLLRSGVAVDVQKAGTGDSLVWYNLEAGTYTVRAENTLGCIQLMTSAIVVSEVPVPTGTIAVNPPVACYGDSVDITIRFVGVPPFSVIYKNPFEEYFTVNNITSYTYTTGILPVIGGQWAIAEIEDANHCRNIYEVVSRPAAELKLGEIYTTGLQSSRLDNTICEGESVTLYIDAIDANDKTLMYLWSTGDTVPSITVAPGATTTYTVEVRDLLSCTFRGSILITVKPPPFVDFYGIPPLPGEMCQNQGPSQLIGVPDGGSFSGPNVINYSTYDPVNMEGGGLDFILYTYVDIYGCKNEILKYYFVNPVPSVNWYVPEELGPPTKYEAEYYFCRFHNDSVPLQGIPRTNSNTIWRLNNSTGFSNAVLIRTEDGAAYIKDALPGSYDITYIYKDNKGCIDSLTKRIYISEDYRDTLDLGALTIFGGQGDTLCRRDTRILVKSGVTDVTFRTNDPLLIIEFDSIAGECWINPSRVNPGKYRIMAFQTDGKGCNGYYNHYSFKDFWIQSPTTILPIDIPKTYCIEHEPVPFRFSSAQPVTGFVTIVKNNIDTILHHIPSDVPATADIIFNPAWGAGTYHIIYNFNDRYCDNTFIDTIRVYPLPVIDMNLYKRDYCYGDVVTFNAKPNGGYYSAGLDSLALNANIFKTVVSGTGAFMITYKYEDSNGCTNQDSIEIYVHGQEEGDMKILGLDSIYCENAGTVEIMGFPSVGDSIVPYFQNTAYLTDLGDGRAMIDLLKTGFNSTNAVTYFIKEYYTDVYNQLDSCIHSVSKTFRVLNESVDFYGYQDGDTICGFIDSLSLIGNKTQNSQFSINTATGTEVFSYDNGRGTLYPSRLPEGWHTVTYHYRHHINGIQVCEVVKEKTFYLLPVAPIAPRLVCSPDNHNSFEIDNSVVGLEYELWTNGTLFSRIPGDGATIVFPPILTEAICAFYINRNQCRTEHPERFRVSPLTVSINKDNDASCFNANNGRLTAVVKGGNAPVSVSWSAGLGGFSSTDLSIGNLTPDTYTVVATDSIGCTSAAAEKITHPTPLVLTINEQSGLLCYGSRDGFVRVMASGGTMPYTYRWLDADNNVVSAAGLLSNVPAGIYRLFVTDRNNCPATLTVEIYESTPIIFQVINVVDVAIYGQATGEIDIDVTGGEAPYSYEWTGLGIAPANRNNQNQAGLIAGTYFVSITDSNVYGCSLDTSVVILQPEKLTVTAVVRDETCYKSGDGSIDLTVSKGQAPYTFAWTKDGNPLTADEDIYNQGKGIYSVIVTDNAGDTYMQSYEIKSPDSLYVFATGLTDTAILCFNGKNAVLQVDARGGVPAYVYEWSGGGVPAADIHNTYLSGIPAGMYRIQVTDTHNCIVTKDFEITQPTELDIVLTSMPPSCYNSTDAWINAAVTGGTAPYSFYWAGADVLPYNQNQSNIGYGNYKLTVTDANGCTKQAEVTLDNPVELKIEIFATPHVCKDEEAEIRFVMNEIGNWDICYTDGVNNNCFLTSGAYSTITRKHTITQTTVFSIVTAAGGAYGCPATITTNDALVTMHNEPVAELLTHSIEICKGEEAKIPITLNNGELPWNVVFREGSSLYERTGIEVGIDTLTVSPAESKTYELISVSTEYCTTPKSEFVDVTVHPLSTLVATCSDITICNGNTTDIQLLLTGEAPWKVYYTEGNTEKILTINTPLYTLTVSPATTTRYYFYKVESGFGCQNAVFSDIIITVHQLPGQAPAITGLGEVCAGSQASYFVPFIPSAIYYEWELPAGATISAGAGTNVITADFSLGAQSGLMKVRAVNACGESDYTTKSVEVVARAGAAAQIVAPDTVCPLQRSISISTPVIDNATEYVWSLPPGFVVESGQGAATIQVSLLAGAATGYIEVYGKNKCNSGTPVQKRIVVNDMPTVEAGADLYTNCRDYITLNATPLSAPYQGAWRLLQGTGDIADINNPHTQVTNLGLGINLFAWEISNHRCAKPDTAIVINNSAAKAEPEITDNYIFCESELTLRAKPPTVGTGRWERVIGFGDIQTPDSPVTLVTGIVGGRNVFRWTTTTTSGSCSDTALVNVYVNTGIAYAGQSDTIYTAFWQLKADESTDYDAEWTVIGEGTARIENPTSPTTMVYNLSPGTNTFRWTVRKGDCEDHDEVTIFVAKRTVANFQLDTTSGCAPLTVKIDNTITGKVKYHWDFGDGTVLDNVENPQQHTYTKSGRYLITLTAVGEEDTDVMTDTVLVYYTPRASFAVIKDTLYFPNTKLLIRDETTPLGSVTKWLWDFGNGDTSTAPAPEYVYQYSGVYNISLHVESYTGCFSDTLVTDAVHVYKCCFVTFPNAFIPNKLHANGGEYSLAARNHDVFYPVWSDVTEYQLEIFNRWGEKVFVSKDVNTGWDGYVNGKLSPTGVYIYRASGKFLTGGSFNTKGEVTLIQ